MAQAQQHYATPAVVQQSYATAQIQQPIGSSSVIIPLPEKFDAKPMNLICNVCRTSITTTTENSCNWLCCCLFGWWALCFCQEVEHKCPNCNLVLGKKKPY